MVARNRQRGNVVVRLAGLAVAGIMIITAASCGSTGLSTDVLRNIDSAVAKAMSVNNIPGAMVGVWQNGKSMYIKTYGKDDIRTGENTNTANTYRIGTTTKTFTSTVALQLVDEKRFSLEDKLDKYVQGIPNGAEITIRQLLNMTSGIFSYTEDADFKASLEQDKSKVWTPEELVAIALKHPPYFAAGQGWHDSDTNYILLGMIVHETTGSDIDREIERRISGPLSLVDTSYPLVPIIPEPFMHGYSSPDPSNPKQLEDVSVFTPTALGAAGAMVSSLEGQQQWAKAFGRGELLRPVLVKEQTTFVPVTGPDASLFQEYGLGVMKFADFIGYGGDVRGYSSAMFYSTQKETTIVLVLNKSPNEIEAAVPLAKGIAKSLFPSLELTGSIYQ
jgi:D-alanyl-D-alanine carboxypeptidase